jgi:hypothetical protein
MNCQRRQGIEALRAAVREMEPPEPPETSIYHEAALWFKTLDRRPSQSSITSPKKCADRRQPWNSAMRAASWP